MPKVPPVTIKDELEGSSWVRGKYLTWGCERNRMEMHSKDIRAPASMVIPAWNGSAQCYSFWKMEGEMVSCKRTCSGSRNLWERFAPVSPSVKIWEKRCFSEEDPKIIISVFFPYFCIICPLRSGCSLSTSEEFFMENSIGREHGLCIRLTPFC